MERHIRYGRQFGGGDHCSGDRWWSWWSWWSWWGLCSCGGGKRHRAEQLYSDCPEPHDRFPVQGLIRALYALPAPLETSGGSHGSCPSTVPRMASALLIAAPAHGAGETVLLQDGAIVFGGINRR